MVIALEEKYATCPIYASTASDLIPEINARHQSQKQPLRRLSLAPIRTSSSHVTTPVYPAVLESRSLLGCNRMNETHFLVTVF